MVGGTVSLSLADVDNLRNQVKDAEAAKKKAEAELVEVKADKRVMQITKTRPFNKHDFKISVDAHRLRGMFEGDDRRNREWRIEPHWGDEFRYNSAVSITPFFNDVADVVDFVNMDDVKAEIVRKLEAEYVTELAELRADKKNNDAKLGDIQQDHAKVIKDLHKEYAKKLEEKDDTILEQSKRYRELEAGKKELSQIELLEERLTELTKELEAEKNKRWYQKF